MQPRGENSDFGKLVFERERRNLNYKEFVMELLDDRHNIEHMLRSRATHSYGTYRGYREDDYISPAFLTPFLPDFPGSTTIDISMEHTREAGSETSRITSVLIEGEDCAPVFLRTERAVGLDDEHTHEVAEQDFRVTKLSVGSIKRAAQSFLPPFLPTDLETRHIIKALSILSPEHDEVLEFIGQGPGFIAQVRYTNLETYKDSIQTLEITHLKTHRSGVEVGTCLRITESLTGRMQQNGKQTVAESLEIEARNRELEQVVTVENLFLNEGKIVRVTLPTRQHIDDIKEALRVLKRARP